MSLFDVFVEKGAREIVEEKFGLGLKWNKGKKKWEVFDSQSSQYFESSELLEFIGLPPEEVTKIYVDCFNECKRRIFGRV